MARIIPANRLASAKSLVAGVGVVNATGQNFTGAGGVAVSAPVVAGAGAVGEAGELLFDGAPPSASSIVPPFTSNSGLSIFDNGEAMDGQYHIGRDLANGSINDFFAYRDYGTPGNLGTQFRSCFGQIPVSFDAFTGTWPQVNPQKLVIAAQYYDTQWGTYSNSRRKFQVILSVVQNSLSQRGQYFFQVLEWDDVTGNFRQGANVFQNLTTFGPADAFGMWDVLRWEIIPDTNGSQVQANYGVGHGNGVLRLWLNNQLIINYTNVNIIRGNPNVGIGRFHLSATSAGASWAGSSTRLHWGSLKIATSAAALPAMPNGPVARTPSGPSAGTGVLVHQKPVVAGVGTKSGTSAYVPAIFKQILFRSGTGPSYDTGMGTRFDPGTSHQLIVGGGHDGLNCVRVTYAQGSSQVTGGWFGGIGTPSGGYTTGGILTLRLRCRMISTFRWNGSGSQQNKQIILFYGPAQTSRFMLHNERPDGNSWSLPDEYASATNNGHFGYWSMKHNIGTPATDAVPLTYQGGPIITPNPSVIWVPPDANGWYHLQMQIKTPSTAGGSNGTFKIWVNNNSFANPNEIATGCSVNIPFGELQIGWFWTDPNNNVACSFDYRDFQAEWATAAQGEEIRFNPEWFPS